MPHLDHDVVLEIVSAFTAAGMVKNDVLDGLLTFIHPEYVAALPEDGSPRSRLMRTLDDLNRTERLVDGSVPLQIWLKNAVPYAAGKPEPRDVISRALAEVSKGFSGVKLGPDFRSNLPSKHERIVLDNDLLPIAFLQRGAEVARAVARIVVSRYDGKQETFRNGMRVRHLGTGWLLTRDLLITNHHVINARNNGELSASADDLELQAKALGVEFDFDAAGCAPSVETVAGLEAFSPSEGPLDYAIVRLARQVDRRPLTIVRTPMLLAPTSGGYPAVNIIQHPEGSPKMVACRNNLVTRVDGAQLWYFTDTMAGSSGSPVLDDQWRVVALHKKWDYVAGVTYQGRETAWVNAGTQISAILEDLEKSGRASLLAEILAG